MKKILPCLLLLISITIYSQSKIVKSLGDFSTLKVYSGIDVELIKSDKQELIITGEKSEKVKIKNTNNTLKISLKLPEVLANTKVKVLLYYHKNINIIDANEGASIFTEGFKQDQLEVKAQEGALITMDLDVKHVTVRSVSGGSIKLIGVVKSQNIEVNKGGIYQGFGLETTEIIVVNAALGGKAEVFTEKTLDAKVSFGGAIFYKGNPEVLKEKKVLGGTIEAKN
jgi:hypothetical protein